MKKSIRLLACLLCVAILFGACNSQNTPVSGTTGQQTGEKTVTIALTSVWDSFMPANTTNSYSYAILDMLFERLTTMNQDGTVSPRLADSWEISEESDSITYHLNQNATWHDGTPLTAEDVVYTCQLMSDADLNLARRTRMMYFAGTDDTGKELSDNSIEVEALDDYTVRFQLKEPMDTLTIFAIVNPDTFILPKHLLEDIPEEELVSDEFWLHPIGAGPMIFDSMISGERVELTSNEDFYLGAPDFDRLIFRVVPAANLLVGLQSGEIDMAGGLDTTFPIQDWEAIKALDNVNAQSQPSLGYQYMAMNTQKEYLTQEVRQAFSMAINRQVIVDQLLLGEGQPIIGPLHEPHQYFNEELSDIPYDPDAAAQILQEAGWDPDRELLMVVSTGIRERVAALIQQDLAKIGVKTRIQTLDFSTLMTEMRAGNYDIGFMGSAGSPDPAESVTQFTVGAINNFTQLTDTTIGDLGHEAARQTTFEARKEMVDEYQATLVEQCPAAFLYSANDLFACNKRITNVPFGTTIFNTNKCVWQWKVAD